MMMCDNGFVNLVEAIMEQAKKDAESSDEKLATEAKGYIEMMRKSFS